MDLRKEYAGLAKDYRSVADSYARVEATTGSTPQADMSLIFQFMKMLDPGSTVREGEYASAEQTRGLPDTVAALYNKAITGETLTDTQRAEFRNQAKSLFERAKQDNAALGDRYKKLAKDSNLDPDQVVIPYGAETNDGTAAPKSKADFDALPSGTKFTAPDGSIRVKP
jgi:hypothetical protein